ncbi:hypothetical protein G6L37_07440 [Agrobacterium rubi]|nr:hypothetical protein [Agrobacterium rubi]NTF25201.1 hypothetical protein [Agrobacterium rubi]
MRLTPENSFSISEMLRKSSAEYVVDDCAWSFDPELCRFQAIFICEDFGKCLVTKALSPGVDEVSAEDLHLMAHFATQELERLMGDIGMMATFNQSTNSTALELPLGIDLEVVYDDPITDPHAPGIDWRAIA